MSQLPGIIGTDDPRQLSQRPQWIRTPKVGSRGFLTNANTTLYAAPSGIIAGATSQRAYVRLITLCNTDAATRTVTLDVVESAGSAGTNRRLLSVMPLGTGQTLELYYPADAFPMDPGESIQGLASVTNVVSCQIRVEELT